jgi:hypothetical protein
MNYLFKCSKRLAMSRSVAWIGLVVACATEPQGPTDTVPGGQFSGDRVVIAPERVTAEVGQRIQLVAYDASESDPSFRRLPERQLEVEWTVSGGTISASGEFSATKTGTYRVVGKGRGPHKADTSIVVVVPPQDSVINLQISPDTAELSTSQGRAFTARGMLGDSTLADVGVTWTATGGAIDAGGFYVAGPTPGTYHVIATAVSKPYADTATVAIQSPTPPTQLPDTTTVPAPSDVMAGTCSGGVLVEPGASIQAAIDANPSGTSFRLAPGIHRNQRVIPKANNRFCGFGAVMDGGRVLTGWKSSGGYWYVEGQVQQGLVAKSNCQSDRPGCSYPEQLWIDGRLKDHVTSLSGVSSNSWYFDYTADRIYIGLNPDGHVVETSVTPYAFGGNATGVTVKGLTIQHYAAARPNAVVNANMAHSWTIDSNLVQDNAGQGIAIGDYGRMRWNIVRRQGQMGYKAQGNNGLIYGNEFAYNNTAGFGPGAGGEAGAGKAVRTNGLVFRRNNSHHNDGPGIWYDIDNQNGLIDSNSVTSNKWRGIFYEISYSGEIAHNVIVGNGFENPAATVGACDGAGVLVSSSSNVEVHHNVLSANKNGLCYQETDRPAGPLGAHDLVNVYSHDNTVSQPDGGRAAGIADMDPYVDPYASSANNVWRNNTYRRGGSTKWRWARNADVSETTWRSVQDAGSVFTP